MSTQTDGNWSLRRRIVGKLLAILFGRPPQRPKLKPSELRRVLLIRNDRLGDYVVTTPVVAALREYAPQATIDVLGSPVNERFIRDDPRINDVIVWKPGLLDRLRTIRDCRRRNYDLTLQLVTRHTTLPAILSSLLTPNGQNVGRTHSYNRGMYDHAARRTDEHMANQTYNVFADALDFGGTEPPIPPYHLHIEPEIERETLKDLQGLGLEHRSFILINLSASESYRILKSERAAELARRLRERYEPEGLKVALAGAPEDREMIERVAADSGAVVVRFPSMKALIAGIGHARLIVTPDTGPVHMASAVGTPVVAYYTEWVKPHKWAPQFVPYRVVLADIEKQSDTISLNQILDYTESLLRETAPADAG